MSTLLIRNARLVSAGRIVDGDLLVRHGRIDRIASGIDTTADEEIDAAGQWLLPGMIDDPILSRYGWSPFAGRRFRSQVATTVVSGQIARSDGELHPTCRGRPLDFLR